MGTGSQRLRALRGSKGTPSNVWGNTGGTVDYYIWVTCVQDKCISFFKLKTDSFFVN